MSGNNKLSTEDSNKMLYWFSWFETKQLKRSTSFTVLEP